MTSKKIIYSSLIILSVIAIYLISNRETNDDQLYNLVESLEENYRWYFDMKIPFEGVNENLIDILESNNKDIIAEEKNVLLKLTNDYIYKYPELEELNTENLDFNKLKSIKESAILEGYGEVNFSDIQVSDIYYEGNFASVYTKQKINVTKHKLYDELYADSERFEVLEDPKAYIILRKYMFKPIDDDWVLSFNLLYIDYELIVSDKDFNLENSIQTMSLEWWNSKRKEFEFHGEEKISYIKVIKIE
jgi:hypothetical protein